MAKISNKNGGGSITSKSWNVKGGPAGLGDKLRGDTEYSFEEHGGGSKPTHVGGADTSKKVKKVTAPSKSILSSTAPAGKGPASPASGGSTPPKGKKK